MSIDILHDTNPITIAAVFGLFLSVWLIVALSLSVRRAMRIQKVERRLGVDDDAQDTDASHVVRLWHQGRETTTTVPDAPSTTGLLQRLEQHFEDAGWRTAVLWIVLCLIAVAMMVGWMVWMISGATIAALGAAGGVFVLFFIYTKIRIDRQVAAFERQLADALAMVARALRAGQPLLSGFQQASEELPMPVRSVFAEICQQHAFGVTMEQAMRRVGTKYDSHDMRLFATAVIIQLQTGGNLAQIMDRLSHVIRDRIRLSRRVRVLTAQTRYSTRILIALPFLVFLGVNLINPHYMTPLYTTGAGKLMLAFSAASLLAGVWSMKWLSALRY